MFETDAEIGDLQTLLDESLGRATGHLRSIVEPGRTVSAERLVRLLDGMCVLSLATVTRSGEPRISAVDGHFLHGRWVVGTAPGAAKARHLARRPAVSVSHLRGEELGVFVHGHAHLLNPSDRPHDPAWPGTLTYLKAHYGADSFGWDEVVFYRVDPTWMVVYRADPDGPQAGTPSADRR